MARNGSNASKGRPGRKKAAADKPAVTPKLEHYNMIASILSDMYGDGDDPDPKFADYLEHIGFDVDWLPDGATCKDLFREVQRFYAPEGVYCLDTVASDLSRWPPIAERVKELRREKYLETLRGEQAEAG